MPGRHVAPRHKAPRSLRRSLSRRVHTANIGVRAGRRNNGANNGNVATTTVIRPDGTATFALLAVVAVATGLGVHADQSDPAVRNTDDRVNGNARVSVNADVQDALADRTARSEQASRSALRPPVVAVQRDTKSRALAGTRQAQSGGLTSTVAPTDPRQIALLMLPAYGWGSGEFSCLDQLWVSESNWNPYAQNSSSGAYGIPQSLPPEKMATAGSDWRTNPATQIEWGLAYIRDSYGSPCGAWGFKLGNNWY